MDLSPERKRSQVADYRLCSNQSLHNSQKSEMRPFTWKREQRQSGHAWAQSVEAGVCVHRKDEWTVRRKTKGHNCPLHKQGYRCARGLRIAWVWAWAHGGSGCRGKQGIVVWTFYWSQPGDAGGCSSKKAAPPDCHLRGDWWKESRTKAEQEQCEDHHAPWVIQLWRKQADFWSTWKETTEYASKYTYYSFL